VLNPIITAYKNAHWQGMGITYSRASSHRRHPTDFFLIGYGEARGWVDGVVHESPADNTSHADSLCLHRRRQHRSEKVNALDFNALATNFGPGSGKLWRGRLQLRRPANTLDFNALA